MATVERTHVMCVGLNCLDIVSECEEFPSEDAKIGTTTTNNRCVSQRWQRGGNASNNSTVLALLGDKPALACTLANSAEKQFMLTDMESYGIDTSCLVYHEGSQCPSSVVLCSLATGSRTIIHSNQSLPELNRYDLQALPLEKFSWVHFEGRNVQQVVEMKKMLRQKHGLKITISVELEKPRQDMEKLIEYADVIIVSKDYARFLGFNDMKAAAEGVAKKAPNTIVIVPWGEEGAAGCDKSGAVVTSSAFPPAGGVIDTLGAGDTFIGATIHVLRQGGSLQDSITFGCKLAGLKVGLRGWQGLKDQLPKEDWVKQTFTK